MSEAKFVSLRKRLDQLGYRQSLSVDSLPLVEKIFGDLLHTTDSLKAAKQELSRRNEQKVIWDQNVEPYKADNARLVRENNELHQQIMKEKEEFENQVRYLKANLRRIEHENTDLKFLNTQYVQKLRALEKESQIKSEKILELQEKNFQAVIHTPGGREKKIPFRRQRMDVDCFVPPGGVPVVQPLPQPDPYVADLLKVADERIAEAQSLLQEKDKHLKTMESNIQDLRRQVDLREEEIERLNEALNGGRPPEAHQRVNNEGTLDKTIAHLNVQIDFLQEANHKLEAALEAETTKSQQLEANVQELSQKQANMCSELKSIDHLAEQMEEEKAAVLAEKNKRIQDLELSAEELKQSIKELKGVASQLKENNEELLSNRGDEVERLSTEVAKRDRRIRQLEQADRQAKQGASKALLEENRKLRGERELLRNTIKEFDSELVEIQQNAKDLATERDNFRLLYEQVRDEIHHIKSDTVTFESSREKRLLVERDDAVMELTHLKSQCRSLKDRLKLMEETSHEEQQNLLDQLKGVKDQLEEVNTQNNFLTERITSQREMVTKLEDELRSSSAALNKAREDAKSHLARNKQLQSLLDSQEKAKLQDRSTAYSQASELERQQSTLRQKQARIDDLEGSESKLKSEVQKLRSGLEELDRERDEMVLSAKERTEELSSLQAKIDQLVQERDDVLGRTAHLQESLNDAGNAISNKEKEIHSLEGQLSKLEQSLLMLTEHKDGAEEELRQLKGDLMMMTKENQVLHQQLQDSHGEKEALNDRLRQYAASVQKLEETLAAKEDEKAGFLGSLRALNEEKERLEANIQAALGDSSSANFQLAALTQERDHLKQLVDHQAQEVEQHLTTLNSYEVQLSSLSTALSKMDHLLRQEQDEKRALSEDVASAREMCAHLTKAKDTAMRELAAQQRENTKLQMQLDSVFAEKEYLTGEVAKKESTVRGLESVISQERTKTYLSQKALDDQQEEVHHLKTQVRQMEDNQTVLGQELRKTQSEQYASSIRSLQSRADSSLPREKETTNKTGISVHSGVSLTSSVRSRDSLEDVIQREKDFMKRELDKLYKGNSK